MKTSLKKPGSALAFSLLYMALLLILIIGVSSLVTRIFRVNSYITQSMQASYNSESAFELALYDLKMHREGYENTQTLHGSQTGSPATSSIGYKIEYRNTEDKDRKISVPLSNDKRQFALFFEDNNKIEDLNATSDLTYWIDGQVSSSYQTSSDPEECMELRLTGKKDDDYETVIAHVRCDNTPTSLLDKKFNQRDITQPTNSTTISLKDFVASHKENYMVANLIQPAKSNTPDNSITLHLSSANGTIASFNKTITTVGKYNNLEIKRRVQFSQDQTPDLLSVAIYQR